jgi:type III pantothenate kinase
VGNSTYHFLIEGKEYKYFLNEPLPKVEGRVYYISVNETALLKLKHQYDDIVDLEPYIQFETSYEGMGLDRKVACIGYEDAVIVDAGSAITVDVMKKGKHKGGFIQAGLKKLQENYPEISRVLDCDFNVKVNLDTIPLNTQDAISYGILKSIIAPIVEIAKNKPIIITGGDAELLSQFIPNSIYKKNLLFENMEGIIHANHCFA